MAGRDFRRTSPPICMQWIAFKLSNFCSSSTILVREEPLKRCYPKSKWSLFYTLELDFPETEPFESGTISYTRASSGSSIIV